MEVYAGDRKLDSSVLSSLHSKELFFCVCGICKSSLKRVEPTAKIKKREEKINKIRIHHEINVLLIMFKHIIYRRSHSQLVTNEHAGAVFNT